MQIKKESSVNRQQTTAFVLTFRFDDSAAIAFLIIHKQQLLHSDWLRACQLIPKRCKKVKCEIECKKIVTECETVRLKILTSVPTMSSKKN